MGRGGRRKRDDSLISLVVLIVIGLYVFHVIANRDWLMMALFTLVALTALSWFFGTQMQTQCGVATRTGDACRLPARGVIFGCRRFHYCEKARARRGKRQQVWEQPPANGRGRKVRDAGLETYVNEVVNVRIVEDMKSRITFRCMVLTTFCTVVGTPLSLFIAVL